MADSKNEESGTEIIASGNNFLALNLHRILAKAEKNVFFSPFSISSAFLMLLQGIGGETAAELKSVLGYGAADTEDISSAFQNIISSLEKDPDGYNISYANSLLIEKTFDVKREFTLKLSSFFKSLVLQVDFRNETEAAVSQVNEWVKEITQNMIVQLLDSLDPQTLLVILNAIYFKGFWAKQFEEKSTFMQYFYNDGIEDEAKLVEMMHLSESFPFVAKETYKALELPYKGDEISMIIILPNSRTGLGDLERDIAPSFISDIRKEMKESKVEVALPKFRLEYSVDLKRPLQKLGLNQIFDCGSDFTGITDSADVSVTQVIHKAVLEVNEEGCEAAAATAVVIQYRALIFNPEFIVDHPFLFVIYNMSNNLILFMGRVKEL